MNNKSNITNGKMSGNVPEPSVPAVKTNVKIFKTEHETRKTDSDLMTRNIQREHDVDRCSSEYLTQKSIFIRDSNNQHVVFHDTDRENDYMSPICVCPSKHKAETDQTSGNTGEYVYADSGLTRNNSEYNSKKHDELPNKLISRQPETQTVISCFQIAADKANEIEGYASAAHEQTESDSNEHNTISNEYISMNATTNMI